MAGVADLIAPSAIAGAFTLAGIIVTQSAAKKVGTNAATQAATATVVSEKTKAETETIKRVTDGYGSLLDRQSSEIAELTADAERKDTKIRSLEDALEEALTSLRTERRAREDLQAEAARKHDQYEVLSAQVRDLQAQVAELTEYKVAAEKLLRLKFPDED